MNEISNQIFIWDSHWPFLCSARVGCAVFTTFFLNRFEANLSEDGLLHNRKFRYICKHHLFASFASYLLQNIRTNLNTNIRFYSKQIHFLILPKICFKIFVLERIHICKSLSKFHIQANIHLKIFTYKRIFACKYSHTSEFLLCIASNYNGKPFTISGLRPFENIHFILLQNIFALKRNK